MDKPAEKIKYFAYVRKSTEGDERQAESEFQNEIAVTGRIEAVGEDAADLRRGEEHVRRPPLPHERAHLLLVAGFVVTMLAPLAGLLRSTPETAGLDLAAAEAEKASKLKEADASRSAARSQRSLKI